MSVISIVEKKDEGRVCGACAHYFAAKETSGVGQCRASLPEVGSNGWAQWPLLMAEEGGCALHITQEEMDEIERICQD